MKRILSMGIILLLVAACGVFTAQAEEKEAIVIQCDEKFHLQAAVVRPDGGFLLAGAISYPINLNTGEQAGLDVPMLMGVGTDGAIQWSRAEEPVRETDMYRDVNYLDDETIIVLRSLDEGQWAVEFLRDGQVFLQSVPINSAWGIEPAKDGVLVFSSPTYTTARISKIGLDGEILWARDWDEPIRFHGILPSRDIHIAFGSRNTTDDYQSGVTTSVVIAFDDQGNELWRQDSEKLEELLFGAVSRQWNIVLLGADDENNPFAAEYTEFGRAWKTHTTLQSVNASTQSIMSFEDGFLIAMSAHIGGEHDIEMARLDSFGRVKRTWGETIGDAGPTRIFLLQAEGRAYLLAYGRVIKEVDGVEIVPYPISIVLKEVPVK